jgi:hypothetical protein
MGYAKEQMIIREERARERARQNGHVCACSEPLLTARERSRGLCLRCDHNLSKDD